MYVVILECETQTGIMFNFMLIFHIKLTQYERAS